MTLEEAVKQVYAILEDRRQKADKKQRGFSNS